MFLHRCARSKAFRPLLRLSHTTVTSVSSPAFQSVESRTLSINPAIKTKLRKLALVKSSQEVFDILEDEKARKTLSRVDVIVALHRIGKFSTPKDCYSVLQNHWFQELQKCFLYLENSHDERDLSNVAWSLAQLQQKATGTKASALLQESTRVLFPFIQSKALEIHSSFTAQGLTNLIWALAKTRTPPLPDLIPALLRVAVSKIKDFSPQLIANLMWSLASLQIVAEKSLVDAMLARTLEIQSTFEPQNISNLMWALVNLNIPLNQSICTALVTASIAKAPDFGPQEIANLFWAFASLKYVPSDAFVEALSNTAIIKIKIFEPQALSNLMWALASLNISPKPTLVDALSSATLAKRAVFPAREISNMFWAFATLAIVPSPDLVHGLSAVVAKTHNLDPQSLSNLMWAFSTLNLSPSKDVLDAVESSVKLGISGFTHPSISSLLLAFASLHINPSQPIIDALTRQATEVCAQFSPQSIANTLWALANLKIIPTGALVRAMNAVIVEKISLFGVWELSTTGWAFASLGISPSTSCFDAMCCQAISLGSDFEPRYISNFMWALSSWSTSPPPELLEIMFRISIEKMSEFTAQSLAEYAVALSRFETVNHDLNQALTRAAISKHKDFSMGQLSVFARHLSVLTPTLDPEFVRVASLQAVLNRKELAPEDMSALLRAFGSQTDEELVHAISGEAMLRLQEFPVWSVCRLIDGFARAVQRPEHKLVQKLLGRLQEKRDELVLEDYVYLLRNLVHIGATPSPLFTTTMSQWVIEKSRDFKPPTLTWYVSSMTSLKLPIEPANLHIMLRRAIQLRHKFKPGDIVQLVRVLRIGDHEAPKDFLTAMCKQSMRIASKFDLQELTELLWLLARQKCLPSVLVGVFSRELGSRCRFFSPSDLLKVLRCFRTIRLAPSSSLSRTICDVAVKRANEFTAAQSFAFMRFCAALGIAPTRSLMRAMSKGLLWDKTKE